jgi:hypothetical protein
VKEEEGWAKEEIGKGRKRESWAQGFDPNHQREERERKREKEIERERETDRQTDKTPT